MKIISLHGVPRSGTTWLQSIFEAHPNIKTIYQPLFSYAFKNKINETSTKEEWDDFVKGMLDTEDEFCNMKSNLHTNNGKTDIIRYKKEEIKYLFMKNVHHHNLIEKFIEFDENIKIICLIRDPRSVIYSQMTAKHEGLNDWLDCKDKNQNKSENYFGFNKWLEFRNTSIKLKELYPNNVILVQYEDLVNNTILELNKLLEFCEIDNHKNIKDVIEQINSKNENYDYSVFRNENTIEKWKGKLDDDIVNFIKNNI